MPQVLFVRVKSGLDPQELEKRLAERKPRFLKVPGLIQKIYGRDESTGEFCGIYFFESEKALTDFRESDLAKTIAEAYDAQTVRREVYSYLYPLHPDRGPFSA